MFKNFWENLKAASIVFFMVLAGFLFYFLIIAGVVALLAIGLFFIVRLLITKPDNDNEKVD